MIWPGAILSQMPSSRVASKVLWERETAVAWAMRSRENRDMSIPGWPVGFGDDEKAEKLLKQALAINPTGIDPNFFYGDFLLEQGDKAQAKIYLDKALAAPARPGREVADEGRKTEIRERLAKL